MIIITGCGRSGTSVMAGVLWRCGLDLGFDASLSENYEHLNIVALNDSLIGCCLDGTGNPATWNSPPMVESLERACGAVLPRVKEFSNSFDGFLRNQGAKDPRFCFTLRMWQRVWPIDKIVYCLRDPDEVAASFLERDDMPLETGHKLWHRYIESFEKVKCGPVFVWNYGEWESPTAMHHFKRLIDFLELKTSNADIARAMNYYDPNRKHHRKGSA